MISKSTLRVIASALMIAGASAVSIAQRASAVHPGYTGGGVTLLPNGWKIAPAGRHLSMGDLPLAMTLSPDGQLADRHQQRLFAAHAARRGPRARRAVSQVFGARRRVARPRVASRRHDGSTRPARQPTRRRTDVGEGPAAPRARRFSSRRRRAALRRPAQAPPTWRGRRRRASSAGIAVTPDGSPAVRGPRARPAREPRRPGHAVDSRDRERSTRSPTRASHRRTGRRSSSRSGAARRCCCSTRRRSRAAGEVAVGEHPNAHGRSRPDGARLFVACAQHERRVGRGSGGAARPTEQISDRALPERAGRIDAQRAGALAGRPAPARRQRRQQHCGDRGRFQPGDERVRGFMPDRLVSRPACCSAADGRAILHAERQGPDVAGESARCASRAFAGAPGQYTGSMLRRLAVASCAVPDAATLAEADQDGLRRDALQRRDAPRAGGGAGRLAHSATRRRAVAHQARLLRHPREPHLRSDPRRPRTAATATRRWRLFGEDITPNAHALARQFVTLDNFYVDAEVSYDGHAFSTAAVRNGLRREDLAHQLRAAAARCT